MNVRQFAQVVWANRPYADEDPWKGDIWDVGTLWRVEIAGPLFDLFDDAWGWRSDWLRASKLVFIGTIFAPVVDGWGVGYVPPKSDELPRECYRMLARYLKGQPPVGRDIPDDLARKQRISRRASLQAWITSSEVAKEIWYYANQVRMANFQEYSRRAPRDLIPLDELPMTMQKEMV